MNVCPHQGVIQYADGWMVTAHELVTEVALDDQTFSSATSRFLQIPNGLDGQDHDVFRALIDRYLTTERVDQLQEGFTQVATTVVEDAVNKGDIDAVSVGAQFAVGATTTWLGWPKEAGDELVDWVHANWKATRSGQLSQTAAVAAWYNSIIDGLVNERVANPRDDVTTELINDTFLGRRLTREEITSILRNWTAGDLGSMALCIGVCMAHLAQDQPLQEELRTSSLTVGGWHSIIDEILRLDDPFIANRRVATKDVTLGGLTIRAGERLYLNWTAANQDDRVFGGYDPHQHADKNLVYGIGRHVCPGRYLASEQLRIFLTTVLSTTAAIVPGQAPPTRAQAPAGGFSQVPLRLEVD